MELKENLAKNLVRHRKAVGLTQSELAKKLNYSDKAISKWERGESAPDVFVLHQIAKFYGVKIDSLLAEPKDDKLKIIRNLPRKRLIICLATTAFIWLAATCFFCFINMIISHPIENSWLAFVVALPVNFIALLIFAGIWGKNVTSTVMLSLTLWSLILAIFLILLKALTYPPDNLWLMFLIGIPLQALIVFWLLYKKTK